jgi:hypothetical protein
MPSARQGKGNMMQALEELPFFPSAADHGLRKFARAYDFAFFFTDPGLHGETEWTRIDDPNQIQPGDIIAYGDGAGGHTGHIWMATSSPDTYGYYDIVHSTSSQMRTADNHLEHGGVQRGTCRVGCNPHGRSMSLNGRINSIGRLKGQ